MPELPEVETVRRRLGPVLEGATIERVEIVDPRLTRPIDPAFVAETASWASGSPPSTGAGSTSSGGWTADGRSSSTSA